MAQPPKPARSEQTIFAKHYRHPLKGERFAEAKAAESERKKYDPGYVTAEDVQAMPREVQTRPDVAERINRSRHDWPENRSTATRALGPLPTGDGSTVEDRPVDAQALFSGQATKED